MNECSICYSDEYKRSYKCSKCDNLFCSDCLIYFINNSNESIMACPNCKKDISITELYKSFSPDDFDNFYNGYSMNFAIKNVSTILGEKISDTKIYNLLNFYKYLESVNDKNIFDLLSNYYKILSIIAIYRYAISEYPENESQYLFLSSQHNILFNSLSITHPSFYNHYWDYVRLNGYIKNKLTKDIIKLNEIDDETKLNINKLFRKYIINPFILGIKYDKKEKEDDIKNIFDTILSAFLFCDSEIDKNEYLSNNKLISLFIGEYCSLFDLDFSTPDNKKPIIQKIEKDILIDRRKENWENILNKTNKEKLEVEKIISKCKRENCIGLIVEKHLPLKKYICKLCETEYCKECLDFLTPDHKCNENEAEDFKYILRTSTSCPNCGIRINKSDGCDVMFCTICHTSFSYSKGTILKGNLHNPHRIEWLKTQNPHQSGSLFEENINGVCVNVREILFTNLLSNTRNFILEYQSFVNHVSDWMEEKKESNNFNSGFSLFSIILDNKIINSSDFKGSCKEFTEKTSHEIGSPAEPDYEIIKPYRNKLISDLKYNEIFDIIQAGLDSIMDYMQLLSQIRETFETKNEILEIIKNLNSVYLYFKSELISYSNLFKIQLNSIEYLNTKYINEKKIYDFEKQNQIERKEENNKNIQNILSEIENSGFFGNNCSLVYIKGWCYSIFISAFSKSASKRTFLNSLENKFQKKNFITNFTRTLFYKSTSESSLKWKIARLEGPLEAPLEKVLIEALNTFKDEELYSPILTKENKNEIQIKTMSKILGFESICQPKYSDSIDYIKKSLIYSMQTQYMLARLFYPDFSIKIKAIKPLEFYSDISTTINTREEIKLTTDFIENITTNNPFKTANVEIVMRYILKLFSSFANKSLPIKLKSQISSTAKYVFEIAEQSSEENINITPHILLSLLLEHI